MYGEQARFFEDEIRPHLRHKKKGILGMAGGGKNMNASQFYITTAAELDSLDDKHTIFGEVAITPTSQPNLANFVANILGVMQNREISIPSAP